MAEEKKTKLSIIIAAVDQATSKIKAINERLDAATKPVREFKKQLGELAEKSGLSSVAEGFKGVGEAAKETLFKVVEIAAVVGEATHLVLELVEQFDDLGKKAERLGVGVDFLAGLRDAAEGTGVPVEALDQSLDTFAVNLGKAQAGTGRMAAFLKKVNPEFLKQLQHAKNNEEAFNDLADALAKETNVARRAALAQAALGDPKLAPLLAKGSKGIKELTDEYLKHAGSQAAAAAVAGKTHEAMLKLKASTDGVKAAIVEGLAPALTVIIGKLSEWFDEHREAIREWVANLGKKLPGAVSALVDVVKSAVGEVVRFVDLIGGWKSAAVLLAGVMAGPLISAVIALGVALLTTPVGWILGGLAALSFAGYEVVKHWTDVKDFFIGMWDVTKAKFGWATTAIRVLLFPIIGIPELIITSWRVIVGFFGALWDDVSGVFSKAWDLIKPIVDKILAAADAVKDAIGTVFGGSDLIKGYTGGAQQGAGGSTSGSFFGVNPSQVLAPAFGQQNAKITVDFANAPRGTKVKTDPQSSAEVDLSVGYNLLGAAL